MKHDSQAFLAELATIGSDLPYSPALLARLFSQTGSDCCVSLMEVAETIEMDQGLTVRILAVANSAYYGLQAEVGSVARAAAVLGMNEIRNIILAVGLKALTGSRELPPEFDLEAYWRHQYTVAALCRSLAEDAEDADPDDLFTAGLLHDLGKLVTALYRPEAWEAMEALAESEEVTSSVAEDRYWGVDHGVIGALLLKTWNFPSALVEPVNWHHAPDLADTHQNRAILLGLSDALVHTLTDEEGEAATAERRRIVEHGCEIFDFDRDELEERCEDIAQDEEVEHFLELQA